MRKPAGEMGGISPPPDSADRREAVLMWKEMERRKYLPLSPCLWKALRWYWQNKKNIIGRQWKSWRMTIVRLQHKIIAGDQSSTNLQYHSKDRLPKKFVSMLPLFNLTERNWCHQPFLLNYQCDEDYDEDDDSQFGNGSDGSVDKAKYLRHYEALQCNCSLHFIIDRSPKPK